MSSFNDKQFDAWNNSFEKHLKQAHREENLC